METARSWLPANAAVPPLAQGALADLADGWSRAWHADEPLRALGRLERGEARGELSKIAWHVCEGGLAIGVSPSARSALGAKALGIALSGAERPAADTALLDRIGGESLDDLKRRAAALFGVENKWRASEGPAHPGTVHRIEIANPVRSLALTLELSADLFARFVKAKLAAAPAPRPFGNAADALGPLPVRLSAVLGRCGVTVAELSGLAEGDVLVLDRSLDAALPLAVEGVPARRGACTLAERDDGIALKITEALAA